MKYKMIETLFPKTKEEDIIKIIYLLENHCTRFGVNTNLRLAHFLAQVREEIGPEFRPISENLNYKAEVLPKIFKNFRGNNLAKKYGRTLYQPANQKMIANIAYANRLGNGDANSNDGWNYRGAGFLQITGRKNFQNVQLRINRYLDNDIIDIVNKDDIRKLKGAFVAGLGYWIWKDLYRLADRGTSKEVVDSITAVINKYTKSYDRRWEHFQKIKHLINT